VHLLQSVSKSITGTLAGILVGKGQLDPDALVTSYVPELEGTSFDGATVRHLLDMRAGTEFDETYSNPDSDLRHSEAQFGWAPGPRPEDNSIAYLATLHNHREHGGEFEYRSILTDTLGLVLERAAETRFGELLGRELWAPLGAEDDASVTIDADGFAVADGGISVTLRDLARFGLLVLNDGAGPSGQVVPAGWIADTLAGEDDSADAFAASDEYREMLPGGHYRNQWWVPAGGQTLVGLGIHGQFLYVDRATRTVCARVSTWPTSLDDDRRQRTLAAFRETGARLSG
jgi:CubicO group peptidase (beta-lactamase class C family)